MRRVIKAIAIGAVLCLAMAIPAAARPDHAGGSQIWIESESSGVEATAADSAMHYGGEASFGHRTRYTDDRGHGPWLRLSCEQDGNEVFQQIRAGFDGGYMYGEAFDLGPSLAWTGGDADCTGILGHYSRNFGKFLVDATVEFQVTDPGDALPGHVV